MEKLKRQTLLEEIMEIRNELKKVSVIIETRLIGVDIPTKEEIKAIREFEARRKRGKIELIPLSKIKWMNVQSFCRKESRERARGYRE